MRAMVIDDSRAARMIIGKILREMGMDVLEASHGLEALRQLQVHPDIELILVDWNMPQMNGLEFVRTLRRDRANDAVRVLMVTSETEASQVARALQAGANEYLMKPFDKEVLVAKLSMMDVVLE
jgi:two-component system chemotaxis response regulator CheY